MIKNYPKRYSDSTIERKRKEVYDRAVKQIPPNFTSLKIRDIKLLFDLYDEIFFSNNIKNKIKELNKDKGVNIDLKYTTSEKQGLRVAGYCQKRQKGLECTYTLHFPATIYVKLFKKGQKTARTGGVICKNRLQCLQMVFEHELIHLLLFLWNFFAKITKGRGKGIYSAHGKLFQCMVYSYFRQTNIRHELNLGEAEGLLTKEDIKVGEKYNFEMKGNIYVGKVLRKNPKRAKLLIETAGKYKGHKANVPYSQLKK